MKEEIAVTLFIIILAIKLITVIINKKEQIKYDNEFKLTNLNKHDNVDDKVVISSVQELYEKKKEPVNKNQNNENVVDRHSNNSKYAFPPISQINSLFSAEYKNAIENIDIIGKLKVYVGKNNECLLYNCITEFPNLLIGGTIMSGKTSYVNTLLCSLLMYESPEQLKLVIFDSKRVDYIVYKDLPHLFYPIITSEKVLESCLKRLVLEKQRRYNCLYNKNINNIKNIIINVQKRIQFLI